MATLKTLVNPYSSIGDLHNQGLDYIAQNLLSFEKLPNKPDIFITLSATFVSKTNVFGNIPYNDIEVAPPPLPHESFRVVKSNNKKINL